MAKSREEPRKNTFDERVGDASSHILVPKIAPRNKFFFFFFSYLTLFDIVSIKIYSKRSLSEFH